MALYYAVEKYIKEHIISNHWPTGYKLPREVDLCNQFGISRTTVRHALSRLECEGLIKRIKGTGTFVYRKQHLEQTNIFIGSFAQELKLQGLEAITEVLEFRFVNPDEELQQKTQWHTDMPFVKLVRLRYAKERFDKGPIVLTTSYFPNKMSQFLFSNNFEVVSMSHVFEEHKIERTTITKKFSAVHLPVKECRLLGASINDLFLFVTTHSKDQNDQVVEYSESYYPVDRNEFTIVLHT